MAWIDLLNADPLPWLLEPGDPGVQYLALRDLVCVSEDYLELVEARTAAHRQGPIATVLNAMDRTGYWVEPGPGYNPKYTSTVWSMILLAQLGASVKEDARITTACNYVLDHTLTSLGQFSMSKGPSGTIDCLQGNLLWSLLELGCTDARLEKAVDWMARSVTGEGIAPAGDRESGFRYYSGKCGPNFACGGNEKLPCAWGAAKVMLAFGKVPKERRTPAVEKAIRMGIDFFFSVDPASAAWPCGYSGKPSGNWWKFGFPVFYVTDLLQVAEALTQLGRGADPRAAALMKMICGKQDAEGRWALEYEYTGKTWGHFGEKKAPNKWVTLRALKVLKNAFGNS